MGTKPLTGTTPETALNPYNIGETNPAVLSDIFDNYGTYGDATQSHHQFRATMDGTAFELPTGEVMMAIGTEYFKQDYKVFFGGGTSDNLQGNNADLSRNVKSIFAEVVVPVMDSDAGVINVTASTRYDKYNDVGSTSNPKVGVDYSPNDELRIRAQWGTSFQAPSLADSGGAVDTRVITIPVSNWTDAQNSDPSDFFKGTILIAGGSDGLKPEESESYSIGFDWNPDSFKDLSVSMTYFNVDYKSAISLAPFWTPSVYFAIEGYQAYHTINPTLEEALAATDGFRIDGMPVEALYANGGEVYLLADARRYNIQATKLSGIDFDISNKWDTSVGEISAGLSGSYTLDREFQAVAGAEYIDEIDERGDYNAVAYIGTKLENFTTNLRVLRTDSWENPNAALGAITTVNLFASYDFGESDYFKNTQVTFNIDNMLDKEPEAFANARGYHSGSVLGRVFYVGLKVQM